MRSVVEETKGAASACRVVDDFCHHRLVLAEIKLVADAYLAGRVNQDVPKAHLPVELAQQEDFYLGTCLLLVAIKACRKDLGVVEDKDIILVEVAEHVAKRVVMLDDAFLGMNDHQPAIVAEGGWFLSNAVFGKLVLELL